MSNEVQALRKGLASLNRSLDKDEFQEQIANELLYLQNYANERRQLLESLRIRCALYQRLLTSIAECEKSPTLPADQKGVMRNGAAIVVDDLEALESAMLSIERELTTIEIKRTVMVMFETQTPDQVDLSLLDTVDLQRLRENVEKDNMAM